VGTSYEPYEGELDSVRPLEEDVLALLTDVNSALGSEVIKRGDVRSAFAGIYPLIDDQINPLVYQGTGDYQIIDHADKDGIDGLISVFGAKYTTARLLAEKAINLTAIKLLRRPAPCRTRQVRLASGDIDDLAAFSSKMLEQFKGLVPAAAIEQLIVNHGTGTPAVLGLVQENPALSEILLPPCEVMAAEVVHAVLEEQAICLEDVVFRRTGLGTLGNPGRPALSRSADLMGELLGWDALRKDEEVRQVEGRFMSHC
jgi:glycerol-3-phosphate dehydrogenase